MARSTTRGRHRIISGSRRATDWVASSAETGTTVLAAATAVLDQSLAIAEPATVIRTRGTFWVRSDQVAASESPFGALGMAVVTDQALAIGVSAIPTPTTDQASDSWFLWEPWAHAFVFGDSTGFASGGFSRYDFDSKAMRKIEDSDSIVIVVENAAATHGCQFLLSFRMLIKLHG